MLRVGLLNAVAIWPVTHFEQLLHLNLEMVRLSKTATFIPTRIDTNTLGYYGTESIMASPSALQPFNPAALQPFSPSAFQPFSPLAF